MLQSPIVEDAIFMPHVTFEGRLPALSSPTVRDDRHCHVLGKHALDLPDHLPALRSIALSRLLLDKLVHLRVAVFGVIQLRMTGEEGRETHIGIVVRTGDRAHKLNKPIRTPFLGSNAQHTVDLVDLVDLVARTPPDR